MQKQSVINHLDRYLEFEGDKEELLTIIIESMIDWDETMQLEGATSFIKPLEKELMGRSIIHNLVGKITNLMFELEDNDDLVNAWAKVFLIAVPQCSIDFLIDEILPVLFPYNSLKEKLSHRILTAELVLEIASVYGEKAFAKEMKIFEFSGAAGEDVNWKIRKLGANRLRRIIKKSLKIMAEEKNVYSDILEKLEELMTDEENFVKIDAFETIITCISFFKENDIKEKLVPIIKSVFEKEVVEHEEFMFPIASLGGELLHTLNKHGVGDMLKTEIIEFYQNMLTHEDKELKKRAVFNLPFFFSEFYGDDEVKTNISDEGEEQKFGGITKEKWDEIVEKLIHDELEELRANQTVPSTSNYAYELDFKVIADPQTMQPNSSKERGLLEILMSGFHEICK